jgi:D-alanyl-D-alanine carboxypeptidase/D-alanyl-D-alanine-endopeptidase (penicillin-binding protein 4)
MAGVGLALAGCGGSSSHHVRTQSAGVGVAPHHHRHHHARVTREQRALTATLAAALRKAGRHTGAEVYDLTTGTLLYAVRAQSPRPPASVEKLYTTVALVRKFPTSMRLTTKLLGVGHRTPGGTWHGDLYLRGGGDPTFGDGGFNHVYEFGYGPTAGQLVAQLQRRKITRVTGRVIADESLFDLHRGGLLTSFAADVPDFGGQMSALTYDHGSTDGKLSPAAFAVKQLTRTMRAAHIQAAPAAFTAKAPHRARTLASVHSPRLSVMIDLMNFRSDDLFAELLTKQLGARFGRAGTISSGAHVIAHEVARYGVHPKIEDGSGLSRDNRSTPHQVVTLLRGIWRRPAGHVLLPSLPVVGVNGTTRRIGKGTAAQGNCIGKTGTLDYVTNLAGYCHVHGGHMVAFALFLDGPGNEQAIQMLGPMVGAIARY